MSDHHVQLGMLIVQIVGFIALACYVWETRRIRQAARDQVDVSHRLLKVAGDQTEGLAKPYLILLGKSRNIRDTIMESHGAKGSTVADTIDAHFVLKNIGSGVALNVTYAFRRLNSDVSTCEATTYVHNVEAGRTLQLAELVTLFSEECQATFCFESIAGRRYRTTTLLNNLVLTGFTLEELDHASDREPHQD